MAVPFLDLYRIHAPIEEDFKAALTNLIGKSSFINGEEVSKFEDRFAKWVGTHHCIGMSSGLMAAIIGLQSLSKGKRKKVILPSMTFVATIEAVIHAGLEPELVDVTEDGLIDLDQVEDLLKKDNSTIVCPVHLYGKIVDPGSLDLLMSKYDIQVFEDACQAHGAQRDKRKAGSLGEASVFSFYPGKNLGALGDGGAVCTNSEKIAQQARAVREHGQTRKNHYEYCGYTARLDTLQAAFLNIKMDHIKEWTRQRVKTAKYYFEELKYIKNIEFQSTDFDGSHVYHLFVVKVQEREKLIKRFEENKIQFGLHYPIAIHQMECYRSYHWWGKEFPYSEKYAANGISLPIFPEIREEEMDKIIRIIKNID